MSAKDKTDLIEVKLEAQDFAHLLTDTWESISGADWSDVSSRELLVMAVLLEAWEKR